MADVFVSYGREDKARVAPIVEALNSLGLHVWSDVRIGAGAQWDEEIEKHLAEAKAIVVCWSHDSVKSTWVKGEAKFAQEQDKLVPCLLEDCRIPIQFQFDQAEDLSGWAGAPDHPGWRKIVDSIGNRVGRPGLPHLLDARASGENRKLLSWAQKYSDDPQAAEIWSLVESNERTQFDADMRSTREAIAHVVKLFNETKDSILRDCAAGFEKWVSDLKTAAYDKRPRPADALSAQESPLDVAALRKISAERDASVEETKRLAAELEKARATPAMATPLMGQPPKTGAGWGAAIAALLLGVALGAGAIFATRGGGDADPAALQSLREQLQTATGDADEARKRLAEAQEEIRKARAEGGDSGAKDQLAATEGRLREMEERAVRAEDQLKGMMSTSTGSIGTLQKQLVQKNLELDQVRATLRETEDKLRDASAKIAALQSASPPRPAPPAPAPAPEPTVGSAPSDADMEITSISRCSVEVGGKPVIDASPCAYGKGAGAEKVNAIFDPKDQRRYKATWRVRGEGADKTAEAYLSGGKSPKARSLGLLRPDGACWVSADGSVRICATK